jgi:protein-tyrosine phosphatase
VPDLIPAYEEAGFEVRHIPMVDQKAASRAAIEEGIAFIDAGLAESKGVLVHCVGGLGRSGMAVAAYLKTRGLESEEAIEAVRKVRGRRAIETEVQEEMVRAFVPSVKG